MSRYVLITAGASGIGKAMAEAFEKNGDSIWIVDSDVEAIEKCSNNWNKSILEVRDEKSILKLFEEIKLKWKGVDVLCANAGIKGPTSLIEHISLEEWKDCLDINLDGVFLFSKFVHEPVVKSLSFVPIAITKSVSFEILFPEVPPKTPTGPLL